MPYLNMFFATKDEREHEKRSAMYKTEIILFPEKGNPE